MDIETFRQALATLHKLGFCVGTPIDNWPRPWGTRCKPVPFKNIIRKFNGLKMKEKQNEK